jgi:phosphoribosyl 1,2-cyclic phosphodiesterase
MTIGITALGSGSRGNAFVIHSNEGNILIDAGFSRKELIRRLDMTGVDPESIQGLLLTHEHDDHAKGCRVFCDAFNIKAYMSSETFVYLNRSKAGRLPNIIERFEPGSRFDLAGFQITPFSVQHDAYDPVGFVLEKDGCKIGVATDLGAVNTLAMQRLKDCDILVLESNYDLNMLHNSQRQMYLKRRIMGRNGHLNNVDAVNALPDLLTERTMILFLVHVSSECNSYDLVRALAADKLAEINRSDILLEVVEQNEPVNTVWLAELRRKNSQPELFESAL